MAGLEESENKAKVVDFKERNNKKAAKLIRLSGFAVLAVFVLIGAYTTVIRGVLFPKLDCDKVQKETQQLINKKQFKEAYAKIKDKDAITKCGTKSSDIKNAATSKLDKIEFYQGAAISAFNAGDKKQAKDYADQVLEANKNMTDEERAKVPNQFNTMIQMSNISSGTYRPQDEIPRSQ